MLTWQNTTQAQPLMLCGYATSSVESGLFVISTDKRDENAHPARWP